MKFCLLTLTGQKRPVEAAQFVFFAHHTPDLDDPERRFTLSPDDLALINPNTRSAPVLRSRRDAEILRRIAHRCPALHNESAPEADQWGFRYKEVVHLAHDAKRFLDEPGPDTLPVLEAKMLWLYDHRAADVVLSETAVVRQGQSAALTLQDHVDPARVALPRSYIDRRYVEEFLSGLWERPWMLTFRDITSSTNERTLVAAVVPFAGLGHTAPLGVVASDERTLLGCLLSSFVADYCCRQRLGGLHLTMNVMRHVNVPLPAELSKPTLFISSGSVADWLRPRVLELTYTAWDLRGYAVDCGYSGPPFRWDPARREMLRAELDAMCFHLYGVERHDVDFIMDTFPIVRRKEEAAHGEYRTKRLILERYDALAGAIATGTDYRTVLDPAPADPRVAHPESSRV